MLSEILGKVKEQGFCVNQLVMHHDTSANAIVCSRFPEILGLSYVYLVEQYESAKSLEEFVKWLKSVGIKYKAWHEKNCTHFKKHKKFVSVTCMGDHDNKTAICK